MTKKKRADELMDKEVLRRLFPKEVRDEVKRVARESDKRADAKERKAREKAEKPKETDDS